MTDIALDDKYNLQIINGQIPLLKNEDEVVRQRLKISLGTLTGDWFNDLEFGIPTDLLFSKGTKGMLDAAAIRIISNTEGVASLISYQSTVDKGSRKYTADFRARTSGGNILEIIGLEII